MIGAVLLAASVATPVAAQRGRAGRAGHAPFYFGGPLGLRDATEEQIAALLPRADWVDDVDRVEAYVPVSDAGTGVVVLERIRATQGSDVFLCIDHDGRHRCGAFDVGREGWELIRIVQRVEPLDDDTYVVESAMRMDGGNGEGSGAYGSAELHLVDVVGDDLARRGWVPISGMEWMTINACGWDEPCYVRQVRRAHIPWSVTAPGRLRLGAVRAERVVADGLFRAYRTPPGRSRAHGPKRLRGRAAATVLALGFPEVRAGETLLPVGRDLRGCYDDEGTTLTRVGCRQTGSRP